MPMSLSNLAATVKFENVFHLVRAVVASFPVVFQDVFRGGALHYIPKDGYEGDYIPCGNTKSHITFARKLHHSQFTDFIGCLKHNGKGMWLECEKLFLLGEHCMTVGQ